LCLAPGFATAVLVWNVVERKLAAARTVEDGAHAPRTFVVFDTTLITQAGLEKSAVVVPSDHYNRPAGLLLECGSRVIVHRGGSRTRVGAFRPVAPQKERAQYTRRRPVAAR